MVFAASGVSWVACGLEQANNVQHKPATISTRVINRERALWLTSNGLVYFAAVYLLIKSAFLGVMGGCVLMLGMCWLSIFDLGNERTFVRKSARLFFAIDQRVI